MAAPLPPPNVAAIQPGLQLITNESALVGIVPAFAGGQAILAAIHAQTLSMNNQFARLSTQMTSSGRNQSARVHNTHVNDRLTPLDPLVHHVTGVPIPLFPANTAAIAGMTGAQLNVVLTALGQPTAGIVATRRERLLRAIGIVVPDLV